MISPAQEMDRHRLEFDQKYPTTHDIKRYLKLKGEKTSGNKCKLAERALPYFVRDSTSSTPTPPIRRFIRKIIFEPRIMITVGGSTVVAILTAIFEGGAGPTGVPSRPGDLGISFERAIEVMDEAAERDGWAVVRDQIIEKFVMWDGYVESSVSPGYIIRPERPRHERQRAFVTLRDPSDHRVIEEGEPISVVGTIGKFDREGIDLVGASVIDR